MEELTNGAIRELGSKKHPLARIIGSVLIGLIALLTGAAIVHGLVLNQCQNNQDKKDFLVAGVVPEGVEVPKAEESKGTTENEPSDLQKCLSGQQPFEAGVSPADTEQTVVQNGQTAPVTSSQPSVQGFSAIEQRSASENIAQVNQISAPARQIPAAPSGLPPSPQPKPAPKPATKIKPAATAKTTAAAKPSAKPKTIAVDLDKLSMAVAMTETHNCRDTKGAALVNNCHGFKKNGKFIKFSSPAESHAYFKQLWAKSYKIFPTYRLAQIYSGNDRPNTWLKNVTYYYYNL